MQGLQYIIPSLDMDFMDKFVFWLKNSGFAKLRDNRAYAEFGISVTNPR